MSFRQKNDRKQAWGRFCRANRELFLHTGLPVALMDDYWAFIYFVEHGYVHVQADGTAVAGRWDTGAAFTMSEAMVEQLRAYRQLIDKLNEAGLGDYEEKWIELWIQAKEQAAGS